MAPRGARCCDQDAARRWRELWGPPWVCLCFRPCRRRALAAASAGAEPDRADWERRPLEMGRWACTQSGHWARHRADALLGVFRGRHQERGYVSNINRLNTTISTNQLNQLNHRRSIKSCTQCSCLGSPAVVSLAVDQGPSAIVTNITHSYLLGAGGNVSLSWTCLRIGYYVSTK